MKKLATILPRVALAVIFAATSADTYARTDDNTIRKGQDAVTEGAYHMRKADSYIRDAEQLLKKAEGFLRDEEYHKRRGEDSKARDCHSKADRAINDYKSKMRQAVSESQRATDNLRKGTYIY